MTSPSPPERVRLYVPWLTILKIFSAAALVWVWLQVWPILMVVLVSLVFAITLEPVVRWLEGRSLKRGLAVLVVGAVTLTIFGAFLFAAVAPLTEQAKLLVSLAASFQESVAVRVPVAVARIVRRGPQDPEQMMAAIAATVPDIASAVLTALAMTLFAFILTLYLLADGRSTYDWLIAYVPRAHLAKANETVAGVTDAVFAYVAGNFVTSIFATVFVFVSLTLLEIPGALMLAALAGVCDFVADSRILRGARAGGARCAHRLAGHRRGHRRLVRAVSRDRELRHRAKGVRPSSEAVGCCGAGWSA